MKSLAFAVVILSSISLFAQEEPCMVPEKGKNYITDSSRESCVKTARLLIPQPQIESSEDLFRGPVHPDLKKSEWGGLNPGAVVQCRYTQEDWGGNSPKFYCLRKDESGNLYGEDRKVDKDTGEEKPAIEGAVAANQDNELLNASGELITDKDGDSIEGDKIKVKYFEGKRTKFRLDNDKAVVDYTIHPRQREMFTEVASTRFLWAMGVPADRMYPVGAVACEGCEPLPFNKQKGYKEDAHKTFFMPAIERKFDGKRLEPLAGRTGDRKVGVSFAELGKEGSIEGQELEIQVALLAMSIIGYHNDSPAQNRLTCAKRVSDGAGDYISGVDKESGICSYPVAMIQDVGSTWGSPKGNRVKRPWEKINIGVRRGRDNPRGDIAAYATERVFRDKAHCVVNRPLGGHAQVSEAARAEFVKRVSKIKPLIPELLKLARFDKMDTQLRLWLQIDKKKVRDDEAKWLPEGSKGEALSGAEVDQHIIDLWTNLITQRIEDIETASCPQ